MIQTNNIKSWYSVGYLQKRFKLFIIESWEKII